MQQSNIITVAVGQCGVQCMNRFWKTLVVEHDLTQVGWQTANTEDLSAMVHFTEHSQNKYTPRCLFIDLESTPLEVIKNSSNKGLYGDHSFCGGKESAANCYARGRFTGGKRILEAASNKYRRLVEECDRQVGVFKVSSLAGGAGSGFTNLFFSENPIPKGIQSTSVELSPSSAFSTSTTAYYNTVLQFNEGYDSFRYHILFDNLTLYKRCLMEGVDEVTYVHLNDIMSQILSSFTSSMRFCGTMDCSIQKIATNLVPFPAMKYLLSSMSRIGTKLKPIDHKISCNQMTCQLFKKSHRLFSERFEEGLFFACNLQYRGKIAISEVHKAIHKVRKIYSPKFTAWCKTGFKLANCWKPSCVPTDSVFQGNAGSVFMLVNNTVVTKSLKTFGNLFDKMFHERACVFWYVSEGLEEGEFPDAREYLETITQAYDKEEKNHDKALE